MAEQVVADVKYSIPLQEAQSEEVAPLQVKQDESQLWHATRELSGYWLGSHVATHLFVADW